MNKRILEVKFLWVLFLATAVFVTACSNLDGLTAQVGDEPVETIETATAYPAPEVVVEATTYPMLEESIDVISAYPAPTEVVATQPPAESPTNTPEPENNTSTSGSDKGSCIPPIAPYPSPQISEEIPFYTFEIINIYPHDPEAFTQGLVWENGKFYEGTGLKGRSSLRRVNAETGEVEQIIPIDKAFFGEGIVIWDDRIIQMTWQNEIAFVYDKFSFEKLGEFTYTGEGWGITHDGNCLIMSDGTNNISFRDPITFEEVGRIQVFDNNGPVSRLNELEYINGEIFANVWQTNLIARIDPQTGQVVGWIDLTNLLDTSTLTQPVDVLNGIAYDAENERLFVTGKLWPSLFEVDLIGQ